MNFERRAKKAKEIIEKHQELAKLKAENEKLKVISQRMKTFTHYLRIFIYRFVRAFLIGFVVVFGSITIFLCLGMLGVIK